MALDYKILPVEGEVYVRIIESVYYTIIDKSISVSTDMCRKIHEFGEKKRANTFGHVDWRGKHLKIFDYLSRMIDIHELEDEYFAVLIPIEAIPLFDNYYIPKSMLYAGIKPDKNAFYICDQIYGVFKLFKYLNIKWRN